MAADHHELYETYLRHFLLKKAGKMTDMTALSAAEAKGLELKAAALGVSDACAEGSSLRDFEGFTSWIDG